MATTSLQNPPSDSAATPLAQLNGRIEEARRLAVTPQAYERPADPMARLSAVLRGEWEEDAASSSDGSASAGLSSGGPSSASAGAAPGAAAGGLDALVGREVLDLLAARPLPGEDRVEAIERLVVALRNPDPDNVRSVLEVLLRTRS